MSDSNAGRVARLARRTLVDGVLVAPIPDEQHGTATAYGYHGCRCARCRAASAAQRAIARGTTPRPERGPCTKPCALPSCGGEITKASNRSWDDFDRQQHCSPRCAGIARARAAHSAMVEPRATAATPIRPLRVVGQTWRPNAPGWPDKPRIFVDHTSGVAEVAS